MTMQITCGRRADFIRLRRDSLLKQIPDEYLSAGLEKSPPTVEDLFDGNALGCYISKIGGVDKLFSKQGSSKSTTLLDSHPDASRGSRTSGGHRGAAPANNQPRERSFRTHDSQRKGKTLQSTGNKGRVTHHKAKQGNKSTRSRYPARYRNRRA